MEDFRRRDPLRGLAFVLLAGACGGGGGAPGAADAGRADAAVLETSPDAAPADPCTAVGAASAPLSLADLAASESRVTLTAAGAGVVADVVLTIDIAHPYPRDLDVLLVSPSGTAITLAHHVGAGDGFEGTRFDDTAELSIVDGTAPFTGAYRPLEPLARLRGEPTAGVWTLRVVDTALGDTGTLRGWSLAVASCPPPECATSTVHLAQGGGVPLAGEGPAPIDTYVFLPAQAGDRVVARARVGVSLTYNWDEDVDITLFSPDKGQIDLSTGNGGSGDDYQGTLFDDAAEQSILDGQAPFTGSFRPEQPLARLAGEAASGEWILRTIIHLDPGVKGFLGSFDSAYVDLDVCELSCPYPTVPAGFPAGEAASSVSVSDPGRVAAAALRLSAHADGAVTFTLRSPAGTTVELGSAADFGGTTFADDAALTLAAGSAPYLGRFQPAQPLGALAGEPAAGSWSLEASPPGSLADWTLFLCVGSE